MITLISDLGTSHCSTDSDALRGIVETAILHEMESRNPGSTRGVSACALNRVTRDLISTANIRSRVRHAANVLIESTKQDN